LKGHPLHPALIPFPFAFLTGALLFDLLGLIEQRPSLWWTGAHLTLAGLAAGLLAAIPGVVDYLYTVPPKSSARSRATRHAVGNVTALLLFAFAWLFRAHDWTPTGLSLLCEALGVLVLAYSGWLGGTLVSRNLISVDHRYAGAGKWQEASVSAAGGQPVIVGRADDLEVDQMKLLHVNGRRIVLARTSDGFTAFDDACTHRGGSLAGGVLVGGTVQCLWHGSQFDAATGEVACGPAKRKIKVYEVTQSKDGELTLTAPRG
jgi:nitrite reductase/ring-hydroxylating ferredoxin subunit/uncharacterized membrane protein